MGDAARPPTPPPVRGAGETDRDAKGLSAGEADFELEEDDEEDCVMMSSLSFAPSDVAGVLLVFCLTVAPG